VTPTTPTPTEGQERAHIAGLVMAQLVANSRGHHVRASMDEMAREACAAADALLAALQGEAA
jgi:hypothetical protein